MAEIAAHGLSALDGLVDLVDSGEAHVAHHLPLADGEQLDGLDQIVAEP